jgi:hypothetical protein
MQNPEQTVISQYANSPSLRQLVANLNDHIDPKVNIDAFFDLVMNLQTAQGFGLDVWGRIVGVGRVLSIASGEYLGFEEAADPSLMGFNQAPFFGGGSATANYALSDSGYRVLIIAKALANICDCSVPAINTVLNTLFPDRGICYVKDNHDMTMTYHFEFDLTPVEVSIVVNSGVLPRPAGVSSTVEII